MRIYWYNGALQLLPEDKRESELLAEISRNLKFGPPPETQTCAPGGSSELGSEGLFEVVVGNKQTGPSRFSGKTNHKQFVPRFDKLP
jgi:hypothetical protein